MRTHLTIDALTEHPWALTRSRLQQLVDAVAAGHRNGVVTLSAAAPSRPLTPRREGTVAIIPIHGEISYRSSWLTEIFGGTSIDAIRSAFREAINAPDVTAVILDIDSPGGTVPGNTELAAEIRAARGGGKPIVAVSNTLMASAAYWIGAQADEVWVTPSGSVGSIGVFAVHEEWSEALEKEGVKVTIFRSADFKAEGNPYEPLSDDAKAHLQARIEALDKQFVGDVAKGRNVSEDIVRSQYGQGRVLMATEALAAGMVDGVATLETVIRNVAKATRATAARTIRAAAEGPLPSASEAGMATGTDDDPDEGKPFRVRAHELAADALALVTHAQARAVLRAKEGRPLFGPDTLASLRTIRDALDELLPADPAGAAAPAIDPAVDPPVPVASAQPDSVPAPGQPATPPAPAEPVATPPPPARTVSPLEWNAWLRSQVGDDEEGAS